jgi:hypothetical protein
MNSARYGETMITTAGSCSVERRADGRKINLKNYFGKIILILPLGYALGYMVREGERLIMVVSSVDHFIWERTVHAPPPP